MYEILKHLRWTVEIMFNVGVDVFKYKRYAKLLDKNLNGEYYFFRCPHCPQYSTEQTNKYYQFGDTFTITGSMGKPQPFY